MIKTIVSTELPIDEQFRIRKNVIKHGRKDGLRFCVVTGTHGDELEGQMVCYELARIASEYIEALDGTLEIYPPQPAGHRHHTTRNSQLRPRYEPNLPR